MDGSGDLDRQPGPMAGVSTEEHEITGVSLQVATKAWCQLCSFNTSCDHAHAGMIRRMSWHSLVVFLSAWLVVIGTSKSSVVSTT